MVTEMSKSAVYGFKFIYGNNNFRFPRPKRGVYILNTKITIIV